MTTAQPMEVKKDGLRQMQDGTWNLTVKVHPNDMPTSLLAAPMGTRYGMALVEIGDDEQPVAAPEPRTEPKELSRSQWAGIRCRDNDFQAWLGGNCEGAPDMAAAILRHRLDIQSRKELDSNPEKAAAWDRLENQFLQDTGRMAERTV